MTGSTGRADDGGFVAGVDALSAASIVPVNDSVAVALVTIYERK